MLCFVSSVVGLLSVCRRSAIGLLDVTGGITEMSEKVTRGILRTTTSGHRKTEGGQLRSDKQLLEGTP